MKRALLAGIAAAAAGATLAAAAPFSGTFVRVGTCTAGGYGVIYNCPEFLQTPGLPAYDAAKGVIALPWSDYQGLDTVPNLEVQEYAVADGSKVGTRVLWSFDQSYEVAKKVQKTNTPADLARVQKQVAALAKPFDKALTDAGYAPVPACKPWEREATDQQPYCPGFETWVCGDVTVAYRKHHTEIAVTARGSTKTVDARAWKKPPVKITGSPAGERDQVETKNCIGAAVRVPGTDKVFVELVHTCAVGGDWCDAGGPTWHAAF